MKAKRSSTSKKPPYGPNIVRAWFDTVIHYALRGLDSERGFLLRRNWTFRFHTSSLEYLGSFADLLASGARDNLEQFVFFFPVIGDTISRHDLCQCRLQECCRTFLTAIVQSSEFRKAFENVAIDAPQALGRDFRSHFGAYSSEEDFMGILAEYLINSVETLPTFYTTAELWNRYRGQLAAALSGPELVAHRGATEQAGSAMFEVVDELAALLRATRSELSLQFDLPYVGKLSGVQ